MRKLLLWTKALSHWLLAAPQRYLCIAVAVLVAAPVLGLLVLGLLGFPFEARIRYIGLFLQILGIIIGAQGILKLALAPLPSFSGRAINLTAMLKGISNTGNVRIQNWTNPGLDATHEERVKALEDNLQDVNQRLRSTQSEIDQRFQKLAKNLKDEQDTRSKADQEIRKKLESSETGRLYISVMGLPWVILGVFMSRMSTEIAKLIK